MLNTINRLWKSKTFWLALAAIVTSIGGYFNGELTLEGLIIAIFGALGGVTIRDGIAKSEAAANVSTEMKLFAAPDIWGSWAGRQLISLVKTKVAPGLVSKAFNALMGLARTYAGQEASDALRVTLQRQALQILREHKLITVYSTGSKTLVTMLFMVIPLSSCAVFDYDGFSLRWQPGGLDLSVAEPVKDVVVVVIGENIVYDSEQDCTTAMIPDQYLVEVTCKKESVDSTWFLAFACVNCSANATMYRQRDGELVYLEGQ